MTSPLIPDATEKPVSKPEEENNLTPEKIAELSVHLPVDARGVALGILATVALIFFLDWAQPFLITLLLGIFFAYTLNPLVEALEKIKIPRIVGASVVMFGVLVAILFGAYALRGQVQQIIEK